jgi:hypothetical protein
MTRKEEIQNYAYNNCISEDVDDRTYNLIVDAIKWADETMLNKVCEYLYQSNRDEMAKMGRSARLINVTEFRKKMTL